MNIDDDLDRLLDDGLLQVPEDFTPRVMQALPLQAAAPRPCHRPWQTRARQRLQWLALAGGTAWGALQLLGFVFGIWAATSAA